MALDQHEQLDGLQARLEAGERGGSEADREALLEFLRRLRLLREEYSDYRRLKLLRHVTRISEHADTRLVDIVERREAAETAVRWIHGEYDSEETNRDYRVALRVFGKRVTDGDDVPDSLAWVSTKTSRNYDPTPDGPELLTFEDHQEMVEAARNSRDAAAIALQFDAGLRGGELRELTPADLVDADHGLQVRVSGKQGTRAITLIPSVPHVRRWLDDHPGGPEDPLWCGLEDGSELSYRGYLEMFKAPARRADIQKTVTPTALRKANASWLARRQANAALIEDRQGRARGSDAVARYVAQFGAKSEQRQYAALHGRDVQTEADEEVAPLECPRCGRETPREEPACMWCGQALEPAAAEVIDETEDDLLGFLAVEDDAERRAAAHRIASELEDDPELTAELLSELVD